MATPASVVAVVALVAADVAELEAADALEAAAVALAAAAVTLALNPAMLRNSVQSPAARSVDHVPDVLGMMHI